MNILVDLTVTQATRLGSSVYAESILQSLNSLPSVNVRTLRLRSLSSLNRRPWAKPLYTILRLILREIFFLFSFSSYIYIPVNQPSFALLVRSDIRFIYTILDTYSLINTSDTTLLARLLNSLTPYMLCSAWKVVVISEHTRKTTLEYYQCQFPFSGSRVGTFASKMHIVSPVVRAFPGLTASDSHNMPNLLTINKKYIDPSSGLILILGAIEPRKNFAFVYEVFTVIVDRCRNSDMPPPRLLISGAESWCANQPSINDLPQYLADLVIFTGFIDSDTISNLVSVNCVLVCCSLEEGFGLPSFEALASGMPAVVASNSALLEQVQYGAIGIDLSSADLWADKIISVLSGAYNPVIESSRIIADFSQYSQSCSVRRLLEF
jgi:glycosyltransferase involved in cell wall biosynthesis